MCETRSGEQDIHEIPPVQNSAGIFYLRTSELPSALAINSAELRKEEFRGITWYPLYGIPNFSAFQYWFLNKYLNIYSTCTSTYMHCTCTTYIYMKINLTWTRTCTRTCSCTSSWTCTLTCTCSCTGCVQVHVHVHVLCMFNCMFKCLFINMFKIMFMCMCMYMCINM
jgi:hypothetical protein